MLEPDSSSIDESGAHISRFGLKAVAGRGFLARLSQDLIDDLVQSSHSAAYPAGTILSPAPDGVGPAIVLSGRLRFFLSAPDGRQLTVHYALPGDIIGTVIRDQSEVTARLEVLQATTLLHLDEAHMRWLAQHNAVLSRAMLGEAMDRLRAVYRMLATRAFTSVRVRVAREIVELAEMMGGLRPGVHLAVTHQWLADATGSVREVVARALRDLRHETVISTTSDGITVLDPTGLRRAAGL